MRIPARYRGRGGKLATDQRFAYEVIKVDSAPTFFVNGERLKGAMSFEELEEKIKPLLKR